MTKKQRLDLRCGWRGLNTGVARGPNYGIVLPVTCWGAAMNLPPMRARRTKVRAERVSISLTMKPLAVNKLTN